MTNEESEKIHVARAEWLKEMEHYLEVLNKWDSSTTPGSVVEAKLRYCKAAAAYQDALRGGGE
jgi:hypothetical protein